MAESLAQGTGDGVEQEEWEVGVVSTSQEVKKERTCRTNVAERIPDPCRGRVPRGVRTSTLLYTQEPDQVPKANLTVLNATVSPTPRHSNSIFPATCPLIGERRDMPRNLSVV